MDPQLISWTKSVNTAQKSEKQLAQNPRPPTGIEICPTKRSTSLEGGEERDDGSLSRIPTTNKSKNLGAVPPQMLLLSPGEIERRTCLGMAEWDLGKEGASINEVCKL